ncbi:hypothetical protein S7711_11082 [Stachybotrys chartarum IBT 7711]|uniref:Methyltransferase domain-containing protein n=1 Tax=Stachybotrys chartarum (strain CBS 109288 / IBT 7711) TaxID=1280523 RepID=A0A084AYF3_STACB|nr:hypothetical protein S7711_11082 [Stachybotrys chartarum IBT 7711]
MAPKSPSPGKSPKSGGSPSPPGETPARGGSVEAPLVADTFDDASDGDSALGIHDDQLSSESLQSSIYNYQQENGRMYHALSKGKYILPNDEDENQRLDIQNYHFLLTFESRRCFAPGAETARRVLDVGTGTGTWAIEFGKGAPYAILGPPLLTTTASGRASRCRRRHDEVPSLATAADGAWQVIGLDLSPIQPDLYSPQTWENRGAASATGTATSGKPPSISCRAAGSKWSTASSPIETDDDTLSDDQAISKWIKLLIEASANLGRPLTDAKHHEQRLVDAGFVNVHRKTFKWPTNSWPKDRHHKEVGLWTLANIGGGLEGLSMALLTRGCGWSKDEVLAFLPSVRKDLRDPRIHAYWPIVVVYGQKPLA